jgi:LytS/YehU family sensor histidine kinase
MKLIEFLFTFSFGPSSRFTIVLAIGITLVISLFLHSREFLLHWKRASLDASRFEREKLSAQYESLKSKVNPQLLFNSLATLKVITGTDKDLAAKFIKHLSDVYRYILDTREKELVSQEEEWGFLQSFVFILRARYSDSVEIRLDEPIYKYFLSPLAIQLIVEMIIENAEFTQERPLMIDVKCDASSVRIGAAVTWKNEQAVKQLNDIVGNVRDRYRFLSDVPVLFTVVGHNFEVALPHIRLSP